MVLVWLAELQLVPCWPQVAHPSLSWGMVLQCSISWSSPQDTGLSSPFSTKCGVRIRPHSKANTTFQAPKELNGLPWCLRR